MGKFDEFFIKTLFSQIVLKNSAVVFYNLSKHSTINKLTQIRLFILTPNSQRVNRVNGISIFLNETVDE